ncbi:MAG: DUF3365 domain-containing protein [Cytophagales bacterium]
MRLLIFIFLSLILFSCYDKPANTSDESFKEEMKEREIKKVSDGAIIEAAMQRGNIIADSAQKLLGSSLKKAIAEGGVQNAVKYCNLAAYPIMDSIESHFGVDVKRASLKVRNPEDNPDELEKQLLEAYQYQIEIDDKLSSNIQRDGEEYLLYTKPITIENALCLKCHGEVGKYLKEEDYQLIKTLYPEDNAVGHQMGDLRGMWSIRISKKEIIKNL